MESSILRVSCKVSEAQRASPLDFIFTLEETQSIDDSMNRPKIEFIGYIYILLQIYKI